MSTPSLLSAMQAIVGSDHATTAAAVLEQHSRDQSSFPARLPDVVVWPDTTDHVSQIVRYANEQRVPVVGWGAASSLEGHPIPLYGGIVVDFGRMNRILTVHEQDFQVTVQPGVLYKDMNAALARHGLFFAPDPGANASIGGMIANNAAGIRTVKYGATRDNVLALEVVVASGDVVRTGSRSVKQSAGYDLTHLFTGSEGTLGLITAATLKLAPIPEHVSAITVAFDSVADAAEAVFGIIGSGLNPGALELLDAATIAALKAEAGFDIPTAPTLFIEFTSASAAALKQELTFAEEICIHAGCTSFAAGMGAEARSQLWQVRHHTFETMVRRHPGLDWLVTDVAVPISQYPAIATFAADAMQRHELPGGIVGHAGDGNLHTITFYDQNDPLEKETTASFNKALVMEALALGGTCTGEHGVGMGKAQYLSAELGETTVAVMRQIKQALDPNNIFNPGKVLPSRES